VQAHLSTVVGKVSFPVTALQQHVFCYEASKPSPGRDKLYLQLRIKRKPTVDVQKMIPSMRAMFPVTPATQQRRAGSLSVCASLLCNAEEGHHIKHNCLEV